MVVDIHNQEGDELIRTLRNNQTGKGYGAEGTCVNGNYVYAVVYFYIPFVSVPTITLDNIQYANASSAEIWKESRHAFIVRAVVVNDGGAGFEFGWTATK